MSRRVYTIVIEEDEDGGFMANCPSLNGVASQGETVEEAVENVAEAMDLYVRTLRQHNESVPPPRRLFTTLVDLADIAAP